MRRSRRRLYPVLIHLSASEMGRAMDNVSEEGHSLEAYFYASVMAQIEVDERARAAKAGDIDGALRKRKAARAAKPKGFQFSYDDIKGMFRR